jgi:hypothetical protein
MRNGPVPGINPHRILGGKAIGITIPFAQISSTKAPIGSIPGTAIPFLLIRRRGYIPPTDDPF